MILTIKYLVLVIQSKKTDYSTKVNEIERKIIDHNHDKYTTTTTEFHKLTSENFAARLKQANLVNKTDFDNQLKNLNKKLLQINQNMHLLKMNLKITDILTQVLLLVKITLIIMGHNFT